MEGGEGMVAVVRGLRDSGLAVTLLDGNRQYTLMQKGAQQIPPVHPTQGQLPQSEAQILYPQYPQHHQLQPRSPSEAEEPLRCDSGAQATDGRYASMYKTAHCNVAPTSPPVQITEFPPQKAELCRGHENFEVGGQGSGEHYAPTRINGSFRGAMSWPDRGSVCSPRQSREPDAFADSLRKYPSPSIERSSDMVERLITYTQAKNLSKNNQHHYPSPPRHDTESYTSSLIMDHNISRNTVPRTSSYQNNYEPEVNVSARSKIQAHESPTRDLRPNEYDLNCRRLMKNTDSYISGTKVENLKNFSAYPCNQPFFNRSVRGKYEQEKSRQDIATSSLTATNSANMEVQAAAEMVSREVATVPREEPIKRTVAVPLSPTSSNGDQKGKGEVSLPPYTLKSSFKSVQTNNMPVDLSIQTTSNNIDIANTLLKSRCYISKRNRKSEEDIKISESRDEVIELLEKVLTCSNADPKTCKFRREVLKEMSNERYTISGNVEIKEGNSKIKNQKLLKYIPVWDSCRDFEYFKDAISNEISSQMNDYKAFNNFFRADIQLGIRKDTDDLYDLIFSCLCNMPIKTMDIFGKPVKKNWILNAYVKRIAEVFITHKSNRGTLKSVILDIIYGIPLAMKTCNKLGYLNKIVESLIKKLYSRNKHETGMNEHKMPITENLKALGNSLKLYVQPTEDELKECIATELKDFFEENNVHEKVTRDVEVEIIDFLIDLIEPIRRESYPYEDFVEEMSILLHQRVANLSQFQARKFTEAIFQKLLLIYRLDNPNDDSMKKSSEPKRDKASNSDIYMHHLTHQIDEWFENLNLQNPKVHDTIFRQDVVSDLASDIVDRHKYLELNPSAKGTEEDELEHLKYQIFKWINLTGINNMETIENASELMQRIQRISRPLQIPHQQNNARTNIFASKCLSIADASRFNDAHTGLVKNRNTKQILPMSTANKLNITMNFNQSLSNSNYVTIPCCAGSSLKPTTTSMKQLNEEYDDFLKEWVQKIPIPTSTAQEKAVADKVRIGIYNGIWKAITKLKFEPATFNNPFCYEDALDEEIEELLGSLPKSQELDDRKYSLKVQLIEKTTNMNELIKSTSAPSSFRQQLLENLFISLPRRNTTSNKNDDPKQSYELLQISKLVEDYILCVRYTDEDIVKANIYRNKLIKEVQTLIDNLKKILGKELVDKDTDIYTTNILNALYKVPLPNEETIKDEADEILLSLEVEQWLLDLPIIQNNNVNDQLQKRKLKDQLVKELLEIEREVNIFDCTGERVLKHEVSMFLSKLPIQEEHKNNISFMAEEFANRMKSRAKQLQGNGTRKSVAFLDSVGYNEFSRNMPSCSSFSNLPGARPALGDQSSYMIRGGSIVRDTCLTNDTSVSSYKYRPQTNANNGQAHPHEPLPSDQYFTLEESQGHHNQPPALQPRMMQQPQTVSNENWQPIPDAYGTPERQFPMASVPKALEWQSVPTASMSNVKRFPERQLSPCCRNASNLHSIAPGILTQALRAGDQIDQYTQRHSLPANVPLETLNPCCSRGRENANLDGIVRQSSPNLEVIRDINQSEEVITHPRLGVPIDQSMNEHFRETSLQRVPDNMSREINQQCLPDQRELSQPRSPANMSTYGEPQGFSTPQQLITQGSPPKPGRKKTQNKQNFRKGFARRRLELKDDTEDNLESEGDEPCPCMKRMFRYQRGHLCYEDFERDDCLPMPYGCSSLVMNNFTVQLCGNVAQSLGSTILEEKRYKSMKSVQTSFSSVDLLAGKCSQRKIKSQEDLRNNQNDYRLQAGVLEWLKEVYTSASNAHVWEEKMKRLAQKLTEPGEEKKMQQKIQKYLKRTPIKFSDGDEEKREFREQLPEKIMRKLKKTYLKPKKRKANHSSPVRIFRIEIPKHNKSDLENIDIAKQSVYNWLKEIPIKDKDFLGRKISTSDVSNLIVNNLEPYLLNIQNFDEEFIAKMKSVIVEILNEIPIELDISDRTAYLNRMAISLVNEIVKTNTSNRSNEYFDNVHNSLHTEDLKKFVVNQIVNIIDRLHLNLDFKRLDLLEEALKETLMKLSEPNKIGDAREDIHLILNNLGGLSTYQTHYFTDALIKHFKEKFNIITSNDRNDQQATCDDSLALHNTKSNDEHKNNENTKFVNNSKEMADIAARLYTENVVRKKIPLGSSNVMVFGVTLSDDCKETTICTTDESIKEINDEDIEASSDLYLKQLIEQIEIWLGTLNIPQIHDKGFRDIAVSDLAGDIIDRHKYLEMNPSSQSTAENELEQLRYQIFKWINKLVGEEQTETVQRASELMRRIQNIPVPMLVKNGDQNRSACHSRSIKETFMRNTSKPNQLKDSVTSPENKESIFPLVSNNIATNKKPNVVTNNPNSLMGLRPNPMATTDRKVNQNRAIDSKTRITSSGKIKTNLYQLNNELDNHSAIPRIPTSRNNNTVINESRPTSGINTSPPAKYSESEETELLPPGITFNEVYPHFDKIFKARVMEIPIDTPNPEQEMLADVARKGLYNGIWKTYFHLKGDPDIENDYSYFAVMLEEKIDDMLDCLPQTQETQKLRPPWKVKVLNDVMTMLQYVHSLTDTPSFRQQISDKFDRQFLRAHFAASSNIYQNDFVVRTADAYILYSKYKEVDPTKANIYRQRLMTKIEELAESVKASNNIDFRHINQAQLCQIAMQILESVPIPRDEILKDEADEILMGEEVEQWYKALPVKPVINETHEILRKRMRELLAKKICDIEKRIDIDEASAELNVQHEVSKFLHEDAYLQQDEDLNIHFMIDELTNRLKTKRQQNMLGYETFKKETPFYSTFAQTDPGEALAGLISIGEQANKSPNVSKDPHLMYASQAATSSHHHFSNDQNVPPSCCQDPYSGMSQIEQPSKPWQRFAPNTSRSSQRPVFSSMDRSSGLTGAQQNQMIEANEQVLYDQGGIANRSQMPSRPELPLNSQVPYPVNQGYNLAVGRNSLGMPSNQPQNQYGQARIPRPELLPSNQQPYQVNRGYRPVDRRRWSLPSGQLQSQNTQVYMPSRTEVPPDMGQPYQAKQDYNPVVDRSRFSLPNGPQPRRNGRAHLSSYPQGPSTGFTSQATGATSSTARVASPIAEPQQEENEETDAEEVRYKCRCMERVWKCKRRHYYEDRDRRPQCLPNRPLMPYACSYFY